MEWKDISELPKIGEPILVLFDDNEVSVCARYTACWAYNHRTSLYKMPEMDVEHIIKWKKIEVYHER